MSSKRPALGFIFVTLLIDIIGLGIIIPVMPKLIQELTGGTLSEAAPYAGWMLLAYSSMQFICAPIVGGLSDRYGRRPVLLASLFGFGLDYIFLALAPTLAWLFVGRIIAGMMGASFTTGAAYIADISTPEKRAQNFGIIGAAFGLGFIIGPMMGGLLEPFGSRVPFMVAAGLSLVNFLYGLIILPESLKPENRRKFEWSRANPISSLLNLKRYPVILGLVASLVLVYISSHAVQSNWSFYTMEKFHWSATIVGYSLAVVGLVFAIVQGGLIRIIIPKLGQQRSVYVGLGMNALGFVLFALATQSWMMFAFTVVYCFGGIAGPALQGIISTQVPSNEQGELQGALTGLMSVTSIIGPPVMTNTFAYFTDSAAPYYLPGAPMLLGAVLTITATIMARASLKKTLGKVAT
ncbi:MAG TPA: TCR/Tet family MFS transporter [Chryseolinea sp.]|nr:TCR/Tet family MFS transporter [Chryseolinea sp.]HPH45976.1 TCR/Tet family MFS transporter [Chryseolinea sp.]HPM29811.1 TCR/Tet family MFS transporter [Chryseolinea sp.]